MYKVLLTTDHCWPYLRQTPNGNGEWGGFKFYSDSNSRENDRFDFWVVLDNLDVPVKKIRVKKDNILLVAMEPPSVRRYSGRFINQFSVLITCQEQIIHEGKMLYPQGQPWFVNKTFDQLSNISKVEKSKKMSLIVSNKVFTDGHKKRLDFAMKVKKHFGETIDLYGRGIADFNDKWDVLAPYKYNICLENSSSKYYFTEKLTDCYLSYTFPLYYGCPNLEDYFNNKAFVNIDIDNLDSSFKTIETLLFSDKHYDNHFEYIKEAREKCLIEYNLFPLIIDVIHKNKLTESEGPYKLTYLHGAITNIIRYYSRKVVKYFIS